MTLQVKNKELFTNISYLETSNSSKPAREKIVALSL